MNCSLAIFCSSSASSFSLFWRRFSLSYNRSRQLRNSLISVSIGSWLLRLTVIPIETLMIYLYIQNFHFKDSFWRSNHKSQFSTTRLVRKFIHSLLSLDPDPLHAVRLRATASLLKTRNRLLVII